MADEHNHKSARTMTFVTCLLLALLGIRLIVSSTVGLVHPFFAFDIPVYLAAIIGVLRKARWGSLLALGYHGASLILALSFIVGSFLTFDYHVWKIFIRDQGIFYVLGAVIMDIFIVGLAWREYTTLRNLGRETRGLDREQT